MNAVCILCCIASNGKMVCKKINGIYLEGSGCSLTEVRSQNLTSCTEKNHEILVRIVGFPAEIRTERVTATSARSVKYSFNY
jgi:hypothetical protein